MANGFPYQMHSFVLLTMIIAGASAFFSAAIGDDEKKARRIGIILEGSFESPEIYRLPEGASKTILVPFYEWDYGVRSFTQKIWEERNMSWETFDKIAKALADKLAESVELDVVRNDNDVVEYILIENKDPFLSGILTSGKLLPRVSDMLGDRIHALVVDRNLVYLFPAAGNPIQGYGASLVEDFLAADLPVSLEVFQIDKTGFRAIGELSRERAVGKE